MKERRVLNGENQIQNCTVRQNVKGTEFKLEHYRFFSILKRGINGVYHHVSREHLNRYLAEFNFRYNNRKVDDDARVVSAIENCFEGKRLMYKD